MLGPFNKESQIEISEDVSRLGKPHQGLPSDSAWGIYGIGWIPLFSRSQNILKFLQLAGGGFPCSSDSVKVTQSCLTLWDRMDYTVHGILQARILEWVAFPFSRRSSQPRDGTQVSHVSGGFFTSWATREAIQLIRFLQTCVSSSWREQVERKEKNVSILLTKV